MEETPPHRALRLVETEHPYTPGIDVSPISLMLGFARELYSRGVIPAEAYPRVLDIVRDLFPNNSAAGAERHIVTPEDNPFEQQECPVCLRGLWLRDTPHTPASVRGLPAGDCGHLVCVDCLGSFDRDAYRCPICRWAPPRGAAPFYVGNKLPRA